MKTTIKNKYYFYSYLIILIIGSGLFYFKTYGLIGVYLILPFALFLLILGVIIIVGAARQLKSRLASSLIQIITTSLLFILLFTGQITRFYETIDWHMNYRLRMEVVSNIISGDLAVSEDKSQNVFKLPDNYRQLSNGGNEIMLYRNGDMISIKFYTDRGFLDHFNAFYFTNDSSEIVKLDKRCKTQRANRKIEDNWYRISY